MTVENKTTEILLGEYILGNPWPNTQEIGNELRKRGCNPVILFKEVTELIKDRAKQLQKGKE